MTASKTRAFGRSSDLQAFLVQGLLDGLPIYRIPNDRRFPAISPVLMTIFVPAHRCGAVPDSHRIPSRRAASAKLTARRKRLQYNVGRGRCQYYRMCFWRRWSRRGGMAPALPIIGLRSRCNSQMICWWNVWRAAVYQKG